MTDPEQLDVEHTVHGALGIETVEATSDRVVLQVAVGPRVQQPFGLLHGGVSAMLIESAASLGAFLNLDPDTHQPAGVELNVSHLSARRDGIIVATGVPLRKGRTLQVWGVDITDGDGGRVAVGRCTVAIVPKR